MACIKKLSSGHYQVDYRVGTLRRRESFQTKREAEEFLRDVKLRPLDRMVDYNPPKEISVGDAVRLYRSTVSTKKSPGTQNLEVFVFKPFLEMFKVRSLSSILPQEMEHYQNILRNRMAPQTANRHLNTLNHFFRRCVEWNYIPRIPTERLKPLKNDKEKVNRTFSATEVKAMMDSAQLWLADIVFLITSVAMRRREVVSLRWSSVDFQKRVFHVESHEDFHPKGYCPRSIPMTDEIFEFFKSRKLEAMKFGFAHQDDRVFLNSVHHPIRPDCLTREFERLGNRIGIKHLSPHKLRHTSLTNMVRADGNLEKIRLIAGHADTRITQRYLHLVPDDLLGTLQKAALLRKGDEK